MSNYLKCLTYVEILTVSQVLCFTLGVPLSRLVWRPNPHPYKVPLRFPRVLFSSIPEGRVFSQKGREEEFSVFTSVISVFLCLSHFHKGR